MNMKEIIGNIDETIEKIDKTASAYECDNHTFEKAGLGNFAKALVNAFTGNVNVEESTEAHKANAKKEPDPEVLHADAVIDTDGQEINL